MGLWRTFASPEKAASFWVLALMCLSQILQLLAIVILAPITAMMLGASDLSSYSNPVFKFLTIFFDSLSMEQSSRLMLFLFAFLMGARALVEIFRNNATYGLAFRQNTHWQIQLMRIFLSRDSASLNGEKMTGGLFNLMVVEPGHAALYLVRVLEYLAKLVSVFFICVGLFVADHSVFAAGILISIPFLAFHQIFLKRKIAGMGRQRLELQERQFEIAHESIASFRQIYIFELENWRLGVFSKVTQLLNHTRIRFEMFKGMPTPLAEILLATVLGAFLLAAAEISTIKDFLPRAVLMLFSGQQLLQAVAHLSGNYLNLSFLVPSAVQVTEAIVSSGLREGAVAESAPRSRVKVLPGSIFAIRQLEMHGAPSGRAAVRIPSLDIPVGGLTILKGPSGSGKSTVLDLISGFRSPGQGEVSLRQSGETLSVGKNLDLGYVSQDCLLFEGSLRENLKLQATSLSDETLVEACSASGLDGLGPHESLDLDHKILEGGKNVSGGQKQRISIARVLARDYSMILMDEPTSALDAIAKSRVMKSIKARSQRVPVVVATHDDELIALADQVVNIELASRAAT
jgi:ABC-type bacteriocin/lantibiotic exporter with double-glycine peptidase domain